MPTLAANSQSVHPRHRLRPIQQPDRPERPEDAHQWNCRSGCRCTRQPRHRFLYDRTRSGCSGEAFDPICGAPRNLAANKIDWQSVLPRRHGRYPKSIAWVAPARRRFPYTSPRQQLVKPKAGLPFGFDWTAYMESASPRKCRPSSEAAPWFRRVFRDRPRANIGGTVARRHVVLVQEGIDPSRPS